MKMYMVGGAVRDEILGVKSKDIDFTVVLEENEIENTLGMDGVLVKPNPFEFMCMTLASMGFKIFVESPEFLTVRAQFPDASKLPEPWASRNGFTAERSKLTADFVLARKESDYTDGRRPDAVVPGSLEDDLRRRDFTMNAIAKATDGSLIDPFNGQQDIADKVIKAVGDPFERVSEDALRAVRALRFAVTKNFAIEKELSKVLRDRRIAFEIRENISDERIQQELSKMFRFDTVHSMWILSKFTHLTDAMFAGTVSLDATMKTKGRG